MYCYVGYIYSMEHADALPVVMNGAIQLIKCSFAHDRNQQRIILQQVLAKFIQK